VIRPLVKLAVFAAITLAMTAILAQTLGSLAFASGTRYRAHFSDVTGLLEGDDVRIAGVRVGQVTGIRLVDSTVAEVTFRVDDSIPLATTVQAKIRYRNLVGQRYVALAEGPGAGDRLRGDGLIPIAQTAPALDLTVLFNGFQPLFNALSPADINKLSYQIVQVLQGESGTMASLIARIASLTAVLAERDAAIGRIVSNLNAVLSTLDDHDAQLDTAIRQLQAFVSGLAGDRAAIGSALVNIGALSSATANLLRDMRPSLAADIDLLGRLSANLNANSTIIGNTLDNLPGRLDALGTTMSGGTWMKFYACELTGPLPVNRNNDPQCRQ
jgi:phospholipid/cholesterol/gamma-HCH transport system substrate-binding protein